MGERLRSDPNWREPSPEEQRENRAHLEKWFRENGYIEQADAFSEDAE
jgi:hypothetical protein